MRGFRDIGALCWIFLDLIATVAAYASSESVTVVANGRQQDSVNFARSYMVQHGIPDGNLIRVDAPEGETIDWGSFLERIVDPLVEELMRLQWIDGVTSSLRDRLGRKRYAVSGRFISHRVLCRGIPLRIGYDPGLLLAEQGPEIRKGFYTNRSSVDGEVAMLAVPGYEITGVVRNPLFQQQVIKVARIDGPTLSSAKALVEQAILVEEAGLMGRAYIDSDFSRHPQGNRWLDVVADAMVALGLELGHVYLVCREIRSAVEVLGFIPRVKIPTSDDWIPALEAAEILAALDELQPALSIYRKRIDSRGIPEELLPRLLSNGSRLAWRRGGLVGHGLDASHA